MDIWRICWLFCIFGSVSGTLKQYFELFNSLVGIVCLEIDDTIPDNIGINNHVEKAQDALDAQPCDIFLSAHFKDIPVLIGDTLYYIKVQWDTLKGVFTAWTIIHDIPKEQTNNTVLFILKQVNSFTLEFKSCNVGDIREYRIHLQVEFPWTTINIDAGVSTEYAFVDASITVFGVYSASGVVRMTWNDWSSFAVVGDFRLMASGKDRGYISSLGNVAKLMGNGANEIVINLQNTLKSANRCLKRAQEYLQEKQSAVKSAHSVFDAGVAKLEEAREYFEEKKRDLQNMRKQWKNDQENLDSICKIQRCELLVFSYIFYMFKQDDPGFAGCVLNNIWCKTKRGAAFVALESPQGAVRLAESLLDGAQTALKVALVIVDKARVVVDEAVAALQNIEKGIEKIMYVIEKADNGLEAVKHLIDSGVNLATLILEAISENVIDIRDCGVTEFVYSKDILESGIEIFCEVNVRGREYKRVSRRLRLCDMFSPCKCTNMDDIKYIH